MIDELDHPLFEELILDGRAGAQGHYRIPFVIWLFLIFLVVGNLTAEINGLSGSGMVENGEWVAIMDAVHYSAGCLLAGLLQKICKRLFIV